MPDVKITKKDGDNEIVNVLPSSAPYEHLKPGDVVEVDDINDQLVDYYVSEMRWNFTHFGDTLELTIMPCKPHPTALIYDPFSITGMSYSQILKQFEH